MPYELTWPDALSVRARVTWSRPYTYDTLNDRQAKEDDTAYLYSLILRLKGEWWPMYIGMVYSQNVSFRLQQNDHHERRRNLEKQYRGAVVHISLGTPEFVIGRRTKWNIQTVERLLIYSNWHENMLN